MDVCIPGAAKPGTGGKSILSVNDMKVAKGHLPKTQPCMFSGDEGADVGLGEELGSDRARQGLIRDSAALWSPTPRSTKACGQEKSH